MKINLTSRFTLGLSSLTLVLSTLAGQVQAQEELKLYNWSDYIAEDTIANFEKETGIKVTYDVYDSNETLEAKLLAGNSGYDLVVPSSYFMELQIKAGVFLPLDRSKLTNWHHLDPFLMSSLQKKDPQNKFGVPYLWGTTGIGYNPEMVKKALGEDAPIDSWDLIFKPEYMEKLADCGVTYLDSPDEMVTIALHYTGQDIGKTKRSDFKPSSPAGKALKGARPYIKQFHSSQYVNDLANGDSCVAVGFSGDVFQAAARAEEADNGVKVVYSIPKEGSEIWFDMLAIPADAKNPDSAHKFINYILRPDVIASITNYVWYANPNPDSNSMIDADIIGDPAIYPSDETRAKLYMSSQLSSKLAKVRNRLWSDLKTGR